MYDKEGYILNVVVTAYNNERDIEKCIRSIIPQYSGNFRLTIAYDRGSSDRTGDICKEILDEGHGFIDLWTLDHSFVGEVRNWIADNTEEEYITFIDGDDYLPPNSINRMMDGFKNPGVTCVLGYMEAIYPDGKRKLLPAFKESKDGKSRICNTCMHPVIFKTELYCTHFRCRPNVKTHEDRIGGYLIPKYSKVHVIEDIMYYYNVNFSSSIRNRQGRIKMFEDIIRIWNELKKEKHLFTDEEWAIIEEDLSWSATSSMFFLDTIKKEKRSEIARVMFETLNNEFPAWKVSETMNSIRKGNILVRDYTNFICGGNFGRDFIKFTESYKMKIINIGTEIYALGGLKGWVFAKLKKLKA